MFSFLKKKINNLLNNINNNKNKEKNINSFIKEIKNILIESDVDYDVTNSFIKKIKKKFFDKNNLSIKKTLKEELIKLMGSTKSKLHIKKNSINIILILGMQGSGKTTFSAKLSLYLKNKKKNPLLLSLDIKRPAGLEQLKILSKKINIPFFDFKKEEKINCVFNNAIKEAIEKKYNVIIIDTYNNFCNDLFVKEEFKPILKKIKNENILFTIDSMIGQDSINIIKSFNDILPFFSGLVLTKIDSDTRGGVALSICSILKKPIKFISFGEDLNSIDIFYPERMVNRILGMGDVDSLYENIQKNFNKKEKEYTKKKILNNNFTFQDFLFFIQKIKEMGGLNILLNMLPIQGIDTDMTEKQLKKIESIIFSMTPYERKYPKSIIYEINRKIRISKGSGTSIKDVDLLCNNYLKFKKIFKNINMFKNISNFF
ncbi:signal recognition particle receptor subunit alpha [Candidatus Shikimatogenerans silvanidophilus]|uniref:signal recognition particle receptor subunit alpha n=1 Tax=Candidatus Shikimatogenerans silvanidophilus TaxID=2782547 RepID=UPI001BA9F767|nr:signal recognition particle receptor subunit alpha [Candidatus Shikimatogenerans silvanidophilus]